MFNYPDPYPNISRFRENLMIADYGLMFSFTLQPTCVLTAVVFYFSIYRHVGDFGNLEQTANGRILVNLHDTVASLFGRHSIIGRAVVVRSRFT